jgi:Transposase DDE domain
MAQISTRTMVNQFKCSFSETALNALGKRVKLCRRERIITPHRLALAMVEAFATAELETIADVHRTFNALCDQTVQYKPFHNQLVKKGFPDYMRLLLSRLLNELAGDVLRLSPTSPFAKFNQICAHDGTSFALKHTLSETFPGRFTKISPAAVELHVNLDLLNDAVNSVVLAADSETERQFLPPPSELTGALLLADRGYFSRGYLAELSNVGGAFIVRGTATMNPLIVQALDAHGAEIKSWRGQRLKTVAARIAKREAVDLQVRFHWQGEDFDCRLVAHPNPREGTPRYLLTNLDRHAFTVEQIADGYRLRWQIELLFKEWKSYANLKAFDTSNANVAEGLIWAALCAATLKRYCAQMTERLRQVAISTRRVAMCAHHVLTDILRALLHAPSRLRTAITRALDYLAQNAPRAHPKRDAQSGRLKTGLQHVFVIC